jgi:protein SCO1/2
MVPFAVAETSPLVVALALLAAVACGSAAPAHAAEGDTRPPVLRDVGIDQRLGEQVPLDLRFRDESGNAAPLRDLFRGKPVILALAYYECPMLCTLVLNGLTSALRALPFDAGEEFDVLTVSIDPRDTPDLAAAKKEKYVGEYRRPGAAAAWHFLTGDEEAIRALAESVGFRYAVDPQSGEIAHAAGIMVLTPAGRIARYFYGVEFAPRDLRLGLVEAAGEKIGSPVDQLLLYCFRYDPSTGRYSAAVMNIVRLAGAATVLGLGSFMLVMWRRDRSAGAARQRSIAGE